MNRLPSIKITNRAILLSAVSIAVFLIFFPAQRLVAHRQSISELEVRLDALQESNAAMSDEAKRLLDPANAALLARERLGVVHPGERSYYFVEPDIAPTTLTPAQEQPKTKKGWWARLWGGIFG